MSKVRVAVAGTIGKAVSIETDAPSRAEMNTAIAAAVAAASTSGTSSGFAATLWKLIKEIPSNIVNLASLSGAGLVTRLAPGTFVVRSVASADADDLVVTNGDGASGNPTIALGPDTNASLDLADSSIQPEDFEPIQEATYVTWDDEGTILPGARQLVAGSNITLDDSVPGELEISSSGGGGGGGVPDTIADLVYWFSSDNLDASSGSFIPALANFAPAYRGANAVNLGGGGATISASQLNSIDVLSFPASSAGRYAFNAGLMLTKASIFMVIRPKSVTTNQVVVNGPTNSLQIDLNTSGKLEVTKTFVAVIGTATNALAINTWVQANMTYDAASGAWAIRTGSAANGSGTNVHAITAGTGSIGYNQQSVDQDGNYDLAELIIYNRVLGSTEISDIETYLNGKWGV